MPKPTKDLEALEELAQTLGDEDLTVAQIQKRFKVSERGAYRWLDYLVGLGYDVAQRRRGSKIYYFIT